MACARGSLTSKLSLPRKELFDIPKGIIYLDGNSLGPPIRGSTECADQVISDEWGQELIKAWNTAGWMSLPQTVGNQIAPVIGVSPDTVATGDTLSIKLYQALAGALSLRPDRRVLLSDAGNFPTDLYMAQGLIDTMDRGHELRTPPPEEVLDSIDERVAVVFLTHVDYRTGRVHDIEGITRRAHEVGAVTIWDLAHSAGAVPLSMESSRTEFAVGCTYKYLNGGPGAPAFIYVRPDIVTSITPALTGWLGHRDPFAMELKYRPSASAERFRIGSPSIIQFKLLELAMRVWEDVDMAELRASSIALTSLFIEEVERRCPLLTLVTPRDSEHRGSQVSFASEHGYPIMQALIERGVIGDFRRPNIMRFGIAPLYLDENDIVEAAEILEEITKNETWCESKYQQIKGVT